MSSGNIGYIDKIAVHLVGNKRTNDILLLSKHLLAIDETLQKLLVGYFNPSFKTEEYFSLYHENDLKYNEVYGFVSTIFEDSSCLMNESINLAKHLYETSYHPNIKEGEFYVVLFRDCTFNSEIVNAVGIFKSENKDTFLKVKPQGGGDFNIETDQGININKLDKVV